MPTILIAAAMSLIVIIPFALLLSRNIVRVPPSEVAVLTGKRRVMRDPVTGAEQEVGYRVIPGGSAFRIPLLERDDRLPLNEMSMHIELRDQRDAEGRAQHISLLVNCRIASESPLLDLAIPRFLGMELEDIKTIVRTTVESRVIDTLLMADLEAEGMTWEELEQRLTVAIRDDLGALGVAVDTIVFRGPPNSNGLVSVVPWGASLPMNN